MILISRKWEENIFCDVDARIWIDSEKWQHCHAYMIRVCTTIVFVWKLHNVWITWGNCSFTDKMILFWRSRVVYDRGEKIMRFFLHHFRLFGIRHQLVDFAGRSMFFPITQTQCIIKRTTALDVQKHVLRYTCHRRQINTFVFWQFFWVSLEKNTKTTISAVLLLLFIYFIVRCLSFFIHRIRRESSSLRRDQMLWSPEPQLKSDMLMCLWAQVRHCGQTKTMPYRRCWHALSKKNNKTTIVGGDGGARLTLSHRTLALVSYACRVVAANASHAHTYKTQYTMTIIAWEHVRRMVEN